MKLLIGTRTYDVQSLEEASATYQAARDASGEGASTWPTGVLMQDESQFAWISYNGRVWAGRATRGVATAQLLYDPR